MSDCDFKTLPRILDTGSSVDPNTSSLNTGGITCQTICVQRANCLTNHMIKPWPE